MLNLDVKLRVMENWEFELRNHNIQKALSNELECESPPEVVKGDVSPIGTRKTWQGGRVFEKTANGWKPVRKTPVKVAAPIADANGLGKLNFAQTALLNKYKNQVIDNHDNSGWFIPGEMGQGLASYAKHNNMSLADVADLESMGILNVSTERNKDTVFTSIKFNVNKMKAALGADKGGEKKQEGSSFSKKYEATNDLISKINSATNDKISITNEYSDIGRISLIYKENPLKHIGSLIPNKTGGYSLHTDMSLDDFKASIGLNEKKGPGTLTWDMINNSRK